MHKVVVCSHVLAADYVDCNFCVRTPSRKARSLHNTNKSVNTMKACEIDYLS